MPLKEYKCKKTLKNGEIKEYSFYKEIKGENAQKRGRKKTARGDINRMIPNLNDEQLIEIRDLMKKMLDNDGNNN